MISDKSITAVREISINTISGQEEAASLLYLGIYNDAGLQTAHFLGNEKVNSGIKLIVNSVFKEIAGGTSAADSVLSLALFCRRYLDAGLSSDSPAEHKDTVYNTAYMLGALRELSAGLADTVTDAKKAVEP